MHAIPVSSDIHCALSYPRTCDNTPTLLNSYEGTAHRPQHLPISEIEGDNVQSVVSPDAPVESGQWNRCEQKIDSQCASFSERPPSVGKIISVYTHDPYRPVMLHDLDLDPAVDDCTACTMQPDTTSSAHMCTQQPASAHVLVSPNLIYVNNRPVVGSNSNGVCTIISTITRPPIVAVAPVRHVICDEYTSRSATRSHQASSIHELDSSSHYDWTSMYAQPDAAHVMHKVCHQIEKNIADASLPHMHASWFDSMLHSASIRGTENVDCFVIVLFRQRCLSYVCPISIEVGEYCVVQCQYGRNVGCVIYKCSAVERAMSRIPIDTIPMQDLGASSSDHMYAHTVNTACMVVQKAMSFEIDILLNDQRKIEDEAVWCARQKVYQLCLPMDIKYCEYQFDRQIVFFYFESKARVQIDALGKSLRQQHGCRIWIQRINEQDLIH